MIVQTLVSGKLDRYINLQKTMSELYLFLERKSHPSELLAIRRPATRHHERAPLRTTRTYHHHTTHGQAFMKLIGGNC